MNVSANGRLSVVQAKPLKPLLFGNALSAVYQVFLKANILNKATRMALYKYLESDEFKPLEQVVTVSIVGATKMVVIDPLMGGLRLLRDFSGLNAMGKKVKKWAEKKGEQRVRHILPSIKLELESVKIN